MIRERPRILRDWVDPEPRSPPGAAGRFWWSCSPRPSLFLGLQAWWISHPGARGPERAAHRRDPGPPRLPRGRRPARRGGRHPKPAGIHAPHHRREGSMRCTEGRRIPDPSGCQHAGRPRPDRGRAGAPAQRRLSRGLRRWRARPPARERAARPRRRHPSGRAGRSLPPNARRPGGQRRGLSLPRHLSIRQGHDAGGDPGEDGGAHAGADLARDPRARRERAI